MRFSAGDIVIATRDGGHDMFGRPLQRPIKGKIYRITSIYKMDYGLGCTLRGMNHKPYRGYFLLRDGEFYFRKLVEPTKKLNKLVPEKRHVTLKG